MTRPLRPASPSHAGPLGRGLASLLLAGAGEWVIRSGNSSGIGLALYLFAIVLFSLDRLAGPKEDVAPSPERPLWPGLLAFAIALGGVGLNLLALRRYGENRTDPAAVTFWLASLAAIVGAGIAAGRFNSWTPRWVDAPLPESRRGRLLFGVSLVGLMALSVATRFYALDRIPLGINADEGDRAAVSLQILRHIGDHPTFDAGWYHISNIYFRLLAGVMALAGTDYVGARALGAAFGVVGVLAVAFLAARHFGWRAGLFAAGLTSTLGALLQFSRETTESGPTAVLWALAALFFLEGIRGGRLLAWVLAGFFGGFSIYFYPPARLWPVMAALVSIYLLVHGLGLRRVRLLPGISAAALAALLTISPFLRGVWETPGLFTVRARETTIFVPDNRLRLGYYDPNKPLAVFFEEQVERSVGLFNRYPDANYFWPCQRPVLPPVLAALFYLGLGTSALRLREPRFAFLTIWFWVGFSGVIVTVETPALQRMAPAILTVALFPAVVLADVIHRVRATAVPGSTIQYRAAAVATIVAGAAVAGSMAGEARYYFVDYARVGAPYSYPTQTGLAVAAEGAGTWVVALGKQFHMLNSGWVRLLAPETPRVGVLSPGMHLPLTLPPNRNLTFLVYPSQEYYLPFLHTLYPGGKEERIERGESGFLFTAYRLPRDRWAAGRGAVARIGSSPPTRVRALGVVPSGVNGTVRWSAVVRFPRFANWGLRLGPGPARLRIDGLDVLSAPTGDRSAETVVSVPRGDHAVFVEGRAPVGVKVEWAVAPPSAWQPLPEALQFAEESSPGGLLGVVEVPGRPPLHWLDRTVASGGLAEEVRYGGEFHATWTGFLTPPVSGVYKMTLRAQGEASIELDGAKVLASRSRSDEPVSAEVTLSARRYAVRISFWRFQDPGVLEWSWTPPGGIEEIVPPSVLTPPAEAGPGRPLPPAAYMDPALLRPDASGWAVW
jgi:hypothetical protein